MAVGITHRDVDSRTVVLDGRMVLGEETIAFRKEVKSLLADGKTSIVLDLKNVVSADSANLGALIAAYSSAKSEGMPLRLCNVDPRFKDLLRITKLHTVFEVFGTEADAARAMAKKVSAH